MSVTATVTGDDQCAYSWIHELSRVGKLLSLPEREAREWRKKIERERNKVPCGTQNLDCLCMSQTHLPLNCPDLVRKGWLTNYFNEEVKENTQKGQKWEAGEIDKGGEGNPWVERNEKTWDSSGRKGSAEGITMDKYILRYCILNFATISAL